MPGFAFATIADLSAGYRRKEFSPVEVLADVSRRLEAIEPVLNMFAHLDRAAAIEQARAAEARMVRGAMLGVLDGIPTSVKDLIAVAGMPQRFGSRTTSAALVATDAPAVARLRAAGAVILGKSTTSEFGCKGVGDSPLTGITRNPWNPALTPGGSSCGAAAMVACGLVPYAIGTDGGGSIRIPAAMTGLFGIKAQFGRVPVFPTSATPTLAHVGPLARTAEDAAHVLQIIAGYDRRDPFTVAGPVPDFVTAARTPRRLRIAWSPTLGFARADPEIAALTEAAVLHLQALGHSVEQVAPGFDDPIGMWTAEFYAGVGTRLRASVETDAHALDPAVLEVLRAAIAQDLKTYYASVFDRYAFREKVRAVMEPFDLLLTPTLPVAAFAAGKDVPPGYEDRNIVSWAMFTYPFNLTGQPAASLPAGLTAAGLPAGLQAVSRAHDEQAIFALAGQMERLTGRSPAHSDSALFR